MQIERAKTFDLAIKSRSQNYNYSLYLKPFSSLHTHTHAQLLNTVKNYDDDDDGMQIC